MKPLSKRIACADFTFPKLTHDQSLDLIAALEFSGVDIGFFEKRGHLQPGRELPTLAKSARALAKKLSDRGLALADLFLIPGQSFQEMAPNHPEGRVRRKARDQFQRVVEFALRAGGRHVGALPGILWDDEPADDSWRRSVDELSWRAGYAREQGIVFSVEPHIGSLIPRPREAARLVSETPGLTLTLDYAHFTRAGIADAEVEPLIKVASHFHCRGGCPGKLQASFGENTIDFGRVLTVMRRTKYAGYLTLEYVWSEWENCNETDNVSETVLFRDFLRRKG